MRRGHWPSIGSEDVAFSCESERQVEDGEKLRSSYDLSTLTFGDHGHDTNGQSESDGVGNGQSYEGHEAESVSLTPTV